MDSNSTTGRVTSSAGDIDLNGDLVGRIRENGTMLDRGRYTARRGLDARLALACEGNEEQAAAVRRLLGVASC